MSDSEQDQQPQRELTRAERRKLKYASTAGPKQQHDSVNSIATTSTIEESEINEAKEELVDNFRVKLMKYNTLAERRPDMLFSNEDFDEDHRAKAKNRAWWVETGFNAIGSSTFLARSIGAAAAEIFPYYPERFPQVANIYRYFGGRRQNHDDVAVVAAPPRASSVLQNAWKYGTMVGQGLAAVTLATGVDMTERMYPGRGDPAALTYGAKKPVKAYHDYMNNPIPLSETEMNKIAYEAKTLREEMHEYTLEIRKLKGFENWNPDDDGLTDLYKRFSEMDENSVRGRPRGWVGRPGPWKTSLSDLEARVHSTLTPEQLREQQMRANEKIMGLSNQDPDKDRTKIIKKTVAPLVDLASEKFAGVTGLNAVSGRKRKRGGRRAQYTML